MRILGIIISLFVCIQLYGQQQPLYTQFMYNKQVYNPAFVAVENAPSLGLVYRTQWVGIEGAPDFQGLSFAMPLRNDRIGIGVNLKRVSIGLSNEILIEGLYGYRIDMGPGQLTLGTQLSLKSFSLNFTGDNVLTTDGIANDPAVADGTRSSQIFNFGLGAYYRSDRIFFGLSVPRIQNVDLNSISDFDLSREERHIYAMAGAKFDINDDLSVTPQILYRYTRNTPLDLDVNASLTYLDRYTAGLTYRLGGDANSIGESLDLILAMQVSEKILIGFAYDYTLSELRKQSSGSLEIIANYRFNVSGGEGSDLINPRYF